MLPNIKFRKAQIIDINVKKNTDIQGFRRRLHNIDYDHLVVALGQDNSNGKSIVQCLEHHSFTMRTLEDAYNVRNHLIGCFELLM